MAVSILQAKEDKYLKNVFIKENINLVKKIISDNFNKTAIYKYEDFLQEGLLGLSIAIDRFDVNKGNKFSTFAYLYIFGYIKSYIRSDYNGGIKTSVAVNEKLNKVKSLLKKGENIEDIKKQINVTDEIYDLVFKDYIIDNVSHYTNSEKDDLYDIFDLAENNLKVPTDVIDEIDLEHRLYIIEKIFSKKARNIIYGKTVEYLDYKSINKKYNIPVNEIRNTLSKLQKYYFLIDGCYNGKFTLAKAKKIYKECSKRGNSKKNNKIMLEIPKVEYKKNKGAIKMHKIKSTRTLTSREKLFHDEAVKRLYEWALKNPGKYINKDSLGNIVMADCNFSDVKEDTIKALRSNGYDIQQVANSYKLVNNESLIATDEELELAGIIQEEESLIDNKDVPASSGVNYKDIKELLDDMVSTFSKKYDEINSNNCCLCIKNKLLSNQDAKNIFQIVNSVIELSNANNKKIKATIILQEE